MNNYLLIAIKESRDALKNRWFILYTLCFATLSVLLLFLGTSNSSISNYSGYGKTAASLINLILFFIPLVSLTLGCISISNERENGTLTYLLSHPITKKEILIGKYFGILLPIWLAIFLGFGLSGVVISFKGINKDVFGFLITILLSLLLASSFLSLGFLISIFSSKTSKSLGVAIFLWLLFLVFGDLGVMGSTVAMGMGVKSVFFLTAINPVEAFKIASLLILSSRFEVLGPAGVYAIRTFGEFYLFVLLIFILFAWTLIPLIISIIQFTYLRIEEK